MKDIIKGEVYVACYFLNDKDAIEKEFKKYEITETKEKITTLENIMGVAKTYNCSNNKITDEDEYKARLTLFLDGIWRTI